MNYLGYSSRQVAEKTGLAFHTIRIYAQKHDVGRKIEGRWFYTEADVERLMNRNKKVGKPSVK